MQVEHSWNSPIVMVEFYLQKYFGELKNDFFSERGLKFYFLNRLADSAQRRLRRNLLSIRPRKINKYIYIYTHGANQELQRFKKQTNGQYTVCQESIFLMRKTSFLL